jgi:hypothetical protein
MLVEVPSGAAEQDLVVHAGLDSPTSESLAKVEANRRVALQRHRRRGPALCRREGAVLDARSSLSWPASLSS